jgi:aerobic C4-dicarboxylate transport protein
VFCVVVHGIAGAGDLKKVGRVGVKALVYFETITTVALVVGLLLAYLFGPGHGMNIDTSTLDAKALSNYADNAHKLQGGGIGSFLMNIIPTTSIDALSRNDVLQVLFFAILFGTSLALVGGEKAEKITSFIDAVSTVLFRTMGLIVRVAPLGVLGAVAYTVGKYGVGSLKQLLSLVALSTSRWRSSYSGLSPRPRRPRARARRRGTGRRNRGLVSVLARRNLLYSPRYDG